MRTKLISLFAVLFLVSACGTTPDESASTSGAGAASSTGGGSGSVGISGTAIAPDDNAAASVDEVAVSTPRPGSQEDLVINVGDRVFFGFDKSSIVSAAEKTLKRQAAWMRRHPAMTVTIEGHTDERGTREYNLALGARRAASVKNFLAALGVAPERIAIISYGKERPETLGHTEAAWSQNRRGVTTVN